MIAREMETPNLLTPFVYFGPPKVTVETPPEEFFLGRELGVTSFQFKAVRAATWTAKAALTAEKHEPLHERIRKTFSDLFGIGIVAHQRGTIYRSIYLTDCEIEDGGMHLELGVAVDEIEGTFHELQPLQPPRWLQTRLQPPSHVQLYRGSR